MTARATITDKLGPREIETLRGIARGHSIADIARQQSVTRDTVRSYLRAAKRKLGVFTREDAIRVARTLGYVTDACPLCGRGGIT